MKVHELSFYSEFECLMGDCFDTCCKGWQITVDNKTYKKYLLEPGKDGRRLRAGIDKEDDQVVIKKHKGKCPFFTKEGKCGIQLTKGIEYMPDVCVVFPRFRTNYRLFSEELLFLSCPETARLFIKYADNFYLIPVEKEIDYFPWCTNEDDEYLRDLLNIRENIIAVISDNSFSIKRINKILIEYGNDLQLSYVDFSKKPDIKEYLSLQETFSIDSYLTDKLVTGGLYHTLLRKASPFLYELFKMYFKSFDKLDVNQAQDYADYIVQKMHRNNPKIDTILRAYYKYYYLSEFLQVYEDYSFLKYIYMAIIHNHFFELFLALYYEKYGSLTNEEIARILMVYERRAEHNETVTYALYSVIENEIIKPDISM